MAKVKAHGFPPSRATTTPPSGSAAKAVAEVPRSSVKRESDDKGPVPVKARPVPPWRSPKAKASKEESASVPPGRGQQRPPEPANPPAPVRAEEADDRAFDLAAQRWATPGNSGNPEPPTLLFRGADGTGDIWLGGLPKDASWLRERGITLLLSAMGKTAAQAEGRSLTMDKLGRMPGRTPNSSCCPLFVQENPFIFTALLVFTGPPSWLPSCLLGFRAAPSMTATGKWSNFEPWIQPGSETAEEGLTSSSGLPAGQPRTCLSASLDLLSLGCALASEGLCGTSARGTLLGVNGGSWLHLSRERCTSQTQLRRPWGTNGPIARCARRSSLRVCSCVQATESSL